MTGYDNKTVTVVGIILILVIALITMGMSMTGDSGGGPPAEANDPGSGVNPNPAGADPVAIEPEPTETEPAVDNEDKTMGKIGVYYSIDSLPYKIRVPCRYDNFLEIVGLKVENNKVKFSIKTDGGEAITLSVKVKAYRGEPYNQEMTHTLISERMYIKGGKETRIERDLRYIEIQADGSPCELKELMIYIN